MNAPLPSLFKYPPVGRLHRQSSMPGIAMVAGHLDHIGRVRLWCLSGLKDLPY